MHQNLQGICTAGGVWHCGATGNDGGVIARHIANGQGKHLRRRTSSRQTAAFDARQMLSNAIHFTDVGATFEQGLIDGLFFCQAQTVRRQGQQSRTPARNEAQHQIILRQTLRERQNFFGSGQTCGIRHGVRGFHNFQSLRHAIRPLGCMAVTCHHHARQRGI